MKRSFADSNHQTFWAVDNDYAQYQHHTEIFSEDILGLNESEIGSDRLHDLFNNTFSIPDHHSSLNGDLYQQCASSLPHDEIKDRRDGFEASEPVSQQSIVSEVSSMTPVAYNEPQNYSICYGMLYRVNVKLLGDMSMLEAHLSNPDIPQLRFHYLFDLAHSDDSHIFVILSNGSHMAEVNKKETEALLSLLQGRSAFLQALVEKRVLHSTIQSSTHAKYATFPININVYGPNQTRVKTEFDVGAYLSDHKLWLQRPAWKIRSSTYENPHFLQTDKEISVTDLKIEASSSQEDGDLETSVNDIFSMLTRGSHLENDAGNTEMHTPLLPHQKKALYFMTQREVGPIPSRFQSWEVTPHNDSKRYRHKVATKLTSPIHPEERGAGILADEMGMGKTFSTLALILTSLDRAREWAQDEHSRLNDNLPSTIVLTHGTLIVVPSPLLLQTWTEEVKKRIIAPLKVMVYHGQKRERDPQVLVQYDVVVTTYHTLVSDYNHNDAVIKAIAWYRIVLDEAHFIRRSTSALYRRVDEIFAKFRWCLTGTPIQNHLEDVGTLFKFLRLDPFDRLSVFRQYISEPFRIGGDDRLRSQKALATLLDFFSLRRTKEILELKQVNEEIRSVRMTPDERKSYQLVSSDMTRSMENNVNQVEGQNKLGMFHKQLQLRLLCNHGTFQHRFHWHRSATSWNMDHNDIQEDLSTLLASGYELPCSGCTELLTSGEAQIMRNRNTCRHVLCSDCRGDIDSECQLCEAESGRRNRSQRSTEQEPPERKIERAQYFRSEGYCSKMTQLVSDLRSVRLSDKSIVFSQWTSTLDLVERHLTNVGIRYERVDGMHEFRYRQRVLDRFRSENHLSVLIMTLGVGANGLDLTVANRVFMLEPQWNPSVELQAIGRTLRIGQKKPVTVIRYVTEDSVEEVIRGAQRKKLGMAAVSGSQPEQYSVDVKDRKV